MECRKARASNRNSREDVKDYMKSWRKENRHKCLGYERKWRELNPDSNKARSHKRRSKEKGAEGFHTGEDILKLRETQKECQICKTEFSENTPATLDHILALANGGSNWPENLQLLCRSCNSAKGAK